MNELRILREKTRVIVLSNGVMVLNIPYNIAKLLSKELRSVALECEEEDKAADIIKDNAILIRRRLPFGLSNRPDIIAESVKESLNNRDLRRYIPGVQSVEAFGVPEVKHGRPRQN